MTRQAHTDEFRVTAMRTSPARSAEDHRMLRPLPVEARVRQREWIVETLWEALESSLVKESCVTHDRDREWLNSCSGTGSRRFLPTGCRGGGIGRRWTMELRPSGSSLMWRSPPPGKGSRSHRAVQARSPWASNRRTRFEAQPAWTAAAPTPRCRRNPRKVGRRDGKAQIRRTGRSSDRGPLSSRALANGAQTESGGRFKGTEPAPGAATRMNSSRSRRQRSPVDEKLPEGFVGQNPSGGFGSDDQSRGSRRVPGRSARRTSGSCSTMAPTRRMPD